HVRVPAGLTTQWGQDIEADVGSLGPGGNKTIKLATRAGQPGPHVGELAVEVGKTPPASTQGTVQIAPGGVTLRQVGAERLLLDGEGELRIQLTNYRERPARNIVVTETLPPGMDFVSATERGIYRPESRTVHWMVDSLEPQQPRLLTVR